VARISKDIGTYGKQEAASEAEEAELVGILIQELNNKLAAGLSETVSTCRDIAVAGQGGSGAGTQTAPVYVIIGASHAGRICEMLEELGIPVHNLTRSGWRPTRENVQVATTELRRVLSQLRGREIRLVYQLLDNSIFLANKDGASTLPVRLSDGHYHVVGSLELIDSDGLRDLLHNVMPLLKAGEDHRKVIIAPIQRYIPAPCCQDPDHLTNFGTREYASNMAADLKSIRESLRSFVYKRNLKNFRVVSGEKLLGWEEGVSATTLKNLWGTDPVHLATAGYRVMANKVKEMMESETPFIKSGSGDDTVNRADWIRRDEATAVRIGGGEWREGGGGEGGQGGSLETLP